MGLASAFKRLAIAKKHERSPEERAFVRRLDFFLLTFGCLSQGRWPNAHASPSTDVLVLYSYQVPGSDQYLNRLREWYEGGPQIVRE